MRFPPRSLVVTTGDVVPGGRPLTKLGTSPSTPTPRRCSTNSCHRATNNPASSCHQTKHSQHGPRSSATPSPSKPWSTGLSTTPTSAPSKAISTGSKTNMTNWPPQMTTAKPRRIQPAQTAQFSTVVDKRAIDLERPAADASGVVYIICGLLPLKFESDSRHQRAILTVWACVRLLTMTAAHCSGHHTIVGLLWTGPLCQTFACELSHG